MTVDLLVVLSYLMGHMVDSSIEQLDNLLRSDFIISNANAHIHPRIKKTFQK